MTLLISFYVFVLAQNVLSFVRYGGNALVLSVIAGTLVYIVIGFVRRQPAARVIAIAFHVLYQLVITFAMAAMLNLDFLSKLLKDMPQQTLPAARVVVIVTFVVITAVNVSAVIYLLRHREYFKAGAEPPRDEEPPYHQEGPQI